MNRAQVLSVDLSNILAAAAAGKPLDIDALFAVRDRLYRLGQDMEADEDMIVITRGDQGQIVAVTRQDKDGRITSVIATAAPASPR